MLSSWMTAGMDSTRGRKSWGGRGLCSWGRVSNALRCSCLGCRGLGAGVALALQLLAVFQRFENLVGTGDDEVAGVEAGFDDGVREVAGADGDGRGDGLV